MNVPADIRSCLRSEIAHYREQRCFQLAPPDAMMDCADLGVSNVTLDRYFDARRSLSALTGRMQLAIVLDAPRVLSRRTIHELLGQLRNYAASAIIAAFPIPETRHDDTWSVADFLGLGFRRLRSARDVRSPYWLYRYDIYDYKITPDWLNARHWANPEQWDKHRW